MDLNYLPLRKVDYLKVISLLGLIVSYSWYAFFIARMEDPLGHLTFLVLLSIALFSLSLERVVLPSKNALALFLSFLVISSAGVLLSNFSSSQTELLMGSIAQLMIALIIVINFAHLNERQQMLLGWGGGGLFIVFVGMIFLQNQHYLFKQQNNLFDIWNHKYHESWLIFFMWGIVALLWKKNRHSSLIAVVIILLTGVVQNTFHSDTAKLAGFISLLVFLFVEFIRIHVGAILKGLLYLYIFISPFLFKFYPFEYLPYVLDKPRRRFFIFMLAGRAVYDNWLFGVGFGKAKTIDINLFFPGVPALRYLPPGETVFYLNEGFLPGGHPHNLALFFWLELGIFGAIFLILFFMILFAYLQRATHQQRQKPAVYALLVSGLVVFSFSFDIWQADIILLYAMFFSMLFMACQSSYAKLHQASGVSNYSKKLFWLSFLAIAVHLANYLSANV